MTAGKLHVPLRTCVACGNKTSKRGLVRIVASSGGVVSIDPTGKMAGRGAYVCRDGRCLDKGFKRGRLEYTLRTKLQDDQWVEVVAELDAATVLR